MNVLACMRACVHACMRTFVCVAVCVCMCTHGLVQFVYGCVPAYVTMYAYVQCVELVLYRNPFDSKLYKHL